MDRLHEADARRDQARTAEQRQPERRQPRACVLGRLLERADRRMERGGAPEQVVEDPARVVDQLVVVRSLQQREVVRRVRRQQAHDAGDEEPERQPALTAADREADQAGEEEDVSERIRDADARL